MNYTDTGDLNVLQTTGPVFKSIFVIVTSVLIISGNIINLIVLPKLKNTSSPTLILLMTLAVIDFSTGVMCAVFGIPSTASGSWLFGRIMCIIVGLLYTTTVGASLLILFIISVDRYLAITKPLVYPSLVTSRRVIASIFLSICTFPISLYFLGTVDKHFDNVVFSAGRGQCLVNFGNPEIAALSISMLTISVLSVIITISVIYLRILIIARRAAKAIDILQLSENSSERQRARGFSRREWKATRTTLIVTGGFTVAWLPFIISQIWEAATGKKRDSTVEFIVFILPTCNSWWNVLIYSVMNKQFRYMCKSMLGCKVDAEEFNGPSSAADRPI